MKKITLTVAAMLLLLSSTGLTSCIGSFTLTNRVLSWNRQVGPKFINELVFFAFWVLPVYEVTAVVDVLVLNSIEFWSGNNPMEASVKTVNTEDGLYIINCDTKGYTVSCPDGTNIRLDFDENLATWSVSANDGESYPFMTMVDDEHVRMVTPDGDFRLVDLSEEGLQAYIAGSMPAMAMR